MTKTLTFKNLELTTVASFLNALSLKKKASRGRSKLINLITAKVEEYDAEKNEATDPYILRDKKGNKVAGDGPNTFKLVEDPQKQAEVQEVGNEIDNELAVIEFTEYSEKMKALYDVIKSYDDELTGPDANAYDLLMDQFEAVFESETEEA